MNELTYKIESQKYKTVLWLPGKRGGEKWETEIDVDILLYIKQVTDKDLLYSTGNSTQYYVMAYKEKEFNKEWIYV